LHSDKARAIDDCNNIVNIPDEWKNHFPFDLVYPVGDAYTSSHDCPTITFWGVDRQVCTIPQITAVVKNVFLAKVAITGLFQL
jgi:hypothetical protein